MNSLRRIFFLAGGLLLIASATWAQDSSDIFLRGYQGFQAGEKCERDGNPREALDRYKSAAKFFEQIAKADPGWQPPIIQYRLKKTRENITRLSGEVAKLPIIEEGPEGPLPKTDSSTPPPKIDTGGLPLPPMVNTTVPLQPARRIVPDRRSPIQTLPPETRTQTALENEVAALRRQLSTARKEQERLQEKLTLQSAELKSALVAVDKTQVRVVETKAQLAQTRDALENATRDRNTAPASGTPSANSAGVNELTDIITKIEAENEVLLAENERLFAKLEAAANYIQSADTSRGILEADRKKIADQRNEAVGRTTKIADNSRELEKLKAGKAELEKTFSKEKSELEAKLAEAKNAGEIDKFAGENKALAARLAAAEQKLSDAARKPEESAKILESLRGEITALNGQLVESRTLVGGRDEQIKALAQQLNQTSGEIARLKATPSPTAEEKRLIAEGDLLRGIILRQLKEQSARNMARHAVEEEIKTLQIKSDKISSQLQVLARPVVQLTDEEKKLFQEPVALLNESAPSSLEVSMAVAKKAPEASTGGPESLATPARALVDQAGQLFDTGNLAEAEKLYQKIVEAAPDNYFALSNLGVTQIQSNKLSAAEVAFKKAVTINPGDSFASTHLGIVYCKQGRFDEAITTLRSAIAANQSDYIAYNYLGVCLGEKDLKSEAEENFKHSIAILDENPDAHFNLAVLYATADVPSLEAAKQHYQKAIALGVAPDPSLERFLK